MVPLIVVYVRSRPGVVMRPVELCRTRDSLFCSVTASSLSSIRFLVSLPTSLIYLSRFATLFWAFACSVLSKVVLTAR